MSQEIVFTSSERGLRAGSTGFCTVRSTVGMPQNLASLLEQLTGYTHPYDAYDRSLFDKHPVNFAHYISRVGGQRFHILCRICNAPLDHTNRSNKLAHLIAFEEGEIDLSHTQGPAAAIHWMIPPAGKKQESGDSRYWITSWPSDQEPCVLPDSNRLILPSVTDKPGPCNVWKQVLGDSGWAAALAESVQDRKRQSVPVVFSSDQKDKCLDLVQEALSLLPPAERWGVTFSTFQSGSLPTKVECRWQFLLDSTDLAQKAIRNQHRTPVIDLTSLKGMRSPASELAAFTNSGKRPWDKASVSLSRPTASKQPDAVPPKLSAASAHPAEDHDEDLDFKPGGYSLLAPDSRPGQSLRKTASVRRNRKRPLSRRLIAVAVTTAVVSGIAVWAYPHLQTKQNDEFVEFDRPTNPPKREMGRPVKLLDSSQTAVASPDPIKSLQIAHPDQQNSATDTESTSKPPTIDPPASNDTSSATPEKEPASTPKPFADLRERLQNIVEEMAVVIKKGKGTVTLSDKVELVSPRNCSIELNHTEALLLAGIELTLEASHDNDEQTWTVFGDPSGPARKQKIGAFSLRKKRLQFVLSKRTELADFLRETAITVSDLEKNDDPVICNMSVPEPHVPLTLADAPRVEPVILLRKKHIMKSKDFQLTCRIEGLPEEYKPEKTDFTLKSTSKNKANTQTFTRSVKIGEVEVTYIDLKVSLIEQANHDIAIICEDIIKYVTLGELQTVTRDDPEKYIPTKFINHSNDLTSRLKDQQEKWQQSLAKRRKSLDSAPPADKEKIKQEISDFETQIKIGNQWIDWSKKVPELRAEMIKNIKIQYKLRRDGSVPEDKQAILVQTEGFE